MRALSEKEEGELYFWIDYIHGLGCFREEGHGYIEQWEGSSRGRIEFYQTLAKDCLSVEQGIWADVGTGPYSVLLALPTQVTKIGIDPLMRHYQHHNLIPEFASDRGFIGLTGFAEDLPLNDETADVVICSNALDHVDNPWKGLSELARITKVGGKIIIEVDIGGQTDFMHPHAFSVEQLELEAKRIGLELVNSHRGSIERRRPGAFLYYVCYSRLPISVEHFPKAPYPKLGDLRPMLVHEGLHGFNIVCLPGPTNVYYGILQSDGAFEYNKIKEKGYKVWFEDTSYDKLIEQIEKYAKAG